MKKSVKRPTSVDTIKIVTSPEPLPRDADWSLLYETRVGDGTFSVPYSGGNHPFLVHLGPIKQYESEGYTRMGRTLLEREIQ